MRSTVRASVTMMLAPKPPARSSRLRWSSFVQSEVHLTDFSDGSP